MRTFEELFSHFDPLKSEAGGFFGGRLADAAQSARVVLWQREPLRFQSSAVKLSGS